MIGIVGRDGTAATIYIILKLSMEYCTEIKLSAVKNIYFIMIHRHV